MIEAVLEPLAEGWQVLFLPIAVVDQDPSIRVMQLVLEDVGDPFAANRRRIWELLPNEL